MKQVRTILIIIIIIITGMLVLNYAKYNANDNTNNEDEKEQQKITYKHFELNIPSNISFKEEDADTFSLKDKNEEEWEAYITIIYDKDKELLNSPEKYYKYIKANTQYNLSNIEKIQVNGTELYICNRYKGESNDIVGILGITNYKGNFIYQIDFIVLKGEYNKDNLKPVINIMNNSKHNSKSKDVYYYEGSTKMLEYE